MANRFLAGLLALAFCFTIALPAHAQAPQTTVEKGRPPRIIGAETAQDTITPEKTALIKEFMKLLNASTDLEAITDQFLEQFMKDSGPAISRELLHEIARRNQSQELSLAEQNRLKSEADETANRILIRIRAGIRQRVNFGELLERAGMGMYGKHFTEEELKELIAFHKTPVAQKLLRLFPQITAETLPKVVEWVTPIVTQLVSEIVADEKKRLMAR